MRSFFGEGKGSQQELDLEHLSSIVEVLNDRFGTDLTDVDKLLLDQFEESWVADGELSDQAQNNTIDNFRLVFDRKFLQTIVTRVDANDEIYKKILDDEDFRATLGEFYLRKVYERRIRFDRYAACSPLEAADLPRAVLSGPCHRQPDSVMRHDALISLVARSKVPGDARRMVLTVDVSTVITNASGGSYRHRRLVRRGAAGAEPLAANTTFEDTLSEQYRQLIKPSLLDALLAETGVQTRSGRSSPGTRLLRPLRQSRSSLRMHGRVRRRTWREWRQGIQADGRGSIETPETVMTEAPRLRRLCVCFIAPATTTTPGRGIHCGDTGLGCEGSQPARKPSNGVS